MGVYTRINVLTYTNECFVSATRASTLATCTDQAADRSGWMMSRVLAVKQSLLSVDTKDMELTTVVTPRTSQYRVFTTHQGNMQVSTVTVVFFCFAFSLPVLQVSVPAPTLPIH